MLPSRLSPGSHGTTWPSCPPPILACGSTTGADILYRLTSDPDPDHWPVLIFDRQNLVEPFTMFPFGMTEFLRKLVVDELDSYDVKFEPMPRFVHWPVAERGGSADSTEHGLRTWAGGRQ